MGELEMEESNHTIPQAKILIFWKSGRAERLNMENQSKKKCRTHYQKEESKADEGET